MINYKDLNEEYIIKYLEEEYEIDRGSYDWKTDNDIETIDDMFWGEVLNFCGCGCPDLVKIEIKKILTILYQRNLNNWNNADLLLKEYFGCNSIYDNSLLLFIAYTLDSRGLTEHGTGIGGCWLTDLGIMYLWLLNHLNLES